jgi:hypothetical protein
MRRHQTNTRRRGNPNWKKGGRSPNPGGRPKVLQHVRAACQGRGQEIVDRLFEIANDKGATSYAAVVALKILAAYAWGSPVSQSALHLIDHRKDGQDGNEVIIEICAGPEGSEKIYSLDELAGAVEVRRDVQAAPAPAEPASQLLIEGLRPETLSVDIEEVERLLAQTRAMADRLEADNERKQRLLAEREPGVVVLDLDDE